MSGFEFWLTLINETRKSDCVVKKYHPIVDLNKLENYYERWKGTDGCIEPIDCCFPADCGIWWMPIKSGDESKPLSKRLSKRLLKLLADSKAAERRAKKETNI